MESYQYRIRKEKSLTEKLDFNLENVKLDNTEIVLITKNIAEQIIVEYEWLKSMPFIVRYCFGIYFTINDKKYLGGVLVFSDDYADNTGVWNKYGFSNKVLLLSRGVCLWWTPKNSASYFIAKACKWIKNNTNYRIITATIDPAAGEVGIIYQSLNWHYIGVMSGNYYHNKETKRFSVYIDGKLRGSRWIRNKLGTMKKEIILQHYPDAQFVSQYRKRRYFYFMDTKINNKKFYNSIKPFIQPYPKKNDDNVIGIIYMIKNKINDKKYIGQTTRGISDRICDYKQGLGNEYLNNSFKKYGWDNFEFSVIDNAKTIDELNSKEIRYILEYNTNDRETGYNIESGGKNSLASQETREKLSKARKGHVQTKKWIEKRIEQFSKPVIKVNIKSNIIIERYPSLADAGKNNKDGLSYEAISRLCLGISRNGDEIVWCYEIDFNNKTLPTYVEKNSREFNTLSNEEINEIYSKYKNDNISMRQLSKDHQINFLTLSNYIKNKEKPESIFEENKLYIAVCKKTDKQFMDYINKTGKLTTHITETYPDFKLESKFKRKQIELQTGKPWYYDYFDFIEQ